MDRIDVFLTEGAGVKQRVRISLCMGSVTRASLLVGCLCAGGGQHGSNQASGSKTQADHAASVEPRLG